jgi:hypothetical protein
MLEQTTVTRSVCDACGAVRYSENGACPGFMFMGAFVSANGVSQPVEFVACKRTHIGKAANAVLDRLAEDHEREADETEGMEIGDDDQGGADPRV